MPVQTQPRDLSRDTAAIEALVTGLDRRVEPRRRQGFFSQICG